MMKIHKLCQRMAGFFLIAVIVLTAIPLACAMNRQDAEYTNADTGYQVVVIDEAELLTEGQQKQIVMAMKPLTQYGHAVLWTTREYYSNEIEQARLKRYSLYGYDSASIFAINMANRKITIQSYGKLYEYIDNSKARSITNNVKNYATRGDYYGCCTNAFAQMYTTANGEKIAEPMKYISYVVISLMAGLIIALSTAFSQRFNPLRKAYERAEIKKYGSIIGQLSMAEIKRETHTVSSGSGRSGGSGCGGGSSCGGGGCGGGGSSSF